MFNNFLKSMWLKIRPHLFYCTETRQKLNQQKKAVEKFELAMALKGKRIEVFKQKRFKRFCSNSSASLMHVAILVDENDDDLINTYRVYFKKNSYYEFGSSLISILEAKHNLMLKVNGKNNKIN